MIREITLTVLKHILNATYKISFLYFQNIVIMKILSGT